MRILILIFGLFCSFQAFSQTTTGCNPCGTGTDGENKNFLKLERMEQKIVDAVEEKLKTCSSFDPIKFNSAYDLYQLLQKRNGCKDCQKVEDCNPLTPEIIKQLNEFLKGPDINRYIQVEYGEKNPESFILMYQLLLVDPEACDD